MVCCNVVILIYITGCLVIRATDSATTLAASGLLSPIRFLRTPWGFSLTGQSLSQSEARSGLDCFRRCSAHDDCLALNVCLLQPYSGTHLLVTCTLLGNLRSGVAIVASEKTCFSAQKLGGDNSSPQPITCQHGGTPTGDATPCLCPPQYAGSHCERHIQNCSEIYSRGFNDSYDGVYLIQPLGAATAFYVECVMLDGGATVPFRRSDNFSSSFSWATFRLGYGLDLLAADRAQGDFFVGLDNLHYLTTQGDWELRIELHYNGQITRAYYNSLVVEAEANRYMINFSAFVCPDGDQLAFNGLAGTSPMLFSTSDNDPERCALWNGGAGWYGPDCSTGHSVFSSTPTWPVGGQNVTLTFTQFTLVPASAGNPSVINPV